MSASYAYVTDTCYFVVPNLQIKILFSFEYCAVLDKKNSHEPISNPETLPSY